VDYARLSYKGMARYHKIVTQDHER
jgi:hypothetical protein